MAALRELPLRVSYSTDKDDLIGDFYSPCLSRATEYWRAVGYFTSSSLSIAAQGIAHLIETGGKIHLIASPALSEEDAEAISRGYRDRTEVLIQAARRSISDIADYCIAERLSALSWLVSSGSMEVRLALRTDESGNIARGIFHEKMGLFTDEQGDRVAFSGSANETAGGLVNNFESIDVFWSWDDPQDRVQRKLQHLQGLWSSEAKGLTVIDFTDATNDLLRRFRVSSPPVHDPLDRDDIPALAKSRSGRPVIPPDIKLRTYQHEAQRSWFDNKGRGIMKMATGTGKTITALSVTARLSDEIALQSTIIICPFRHLVTQWDSECRKFGMTPILAFESKMKWQARLINALYNLSTDSSQFVSVITTNETFLSNAFQSQLKHFPMKTMLTADEVHNLGASRLRESLPPGIGLRLGLSATPERWFDEEGTAELFDYFGPVLQPELTLSDGIKYGALCPYRYYPLLVELTEDERNEYLRLSARIARVSQGNADREDNEALTSLLVQRARLIAAASNKMTVLRSIMQERRSMSHVLFYCGDGRVEAPTTGEERRQIDAVCELLGKELGFRVDSYTEKDSTATRTAKRRSFEAGKLQGLVAIRCLDEGVDIPAVRTAIILASSSNPRQFIQRRGRILRPSPGKDHAEVFDMIVVPPNDVCEWESERTMLSKELRRLAEFADLALNSGQARSKILELQKKFSLMDI